MEYNAKLYKNEASTIVPHNYILELKVMKNSVVTQNVLHTKTKANF